MCRWAHVPFAFRALLFSRLRPDFLSTFKRAHTLSLSLSYLKKNWSDFTVKDLLYRCRLRTQRCCDCTGETRKETSCKLRHRKQSDEFHFYRCYTSLRADQSAVTVNNPHHLSEINLYYESCVFSAAFEPKKKTMNSCYATSFIVDMFLLHRPNELILVKHFST